jgi:succinate dehydrogenase / fumarate reductase iron-sulfur subunit
MTNDTREVVFLIFRGTAEGGRYEDYRISVSHGTVVLDAVLDIQAKHAADLGIRCNCTAGKCGSCSAEINGIPRLMCKTRLSDLPLDKPVKVGPLKAFPVIKDLVTDVSWNYEVNKKIPPFAPADDTDWRMQQFEVDRVQEYRKCIECFLCQDTCHVIRSHDKRNEFFGPRFFVRLAGLIFHPLDKADRIPLLKNAGGIGLCNVTHCCTDNCPEKIRITDNAIIPLKERVADRFYDPVFALMTKMFGKGARS